MKRKKSRILFPILAVSVLLAALTATVWAAYFAKGEFKDVFVNKKDYFAADVLYDVKPTDTGMQEVGSAGPKRTISVYNHDVSTGDFNGFDVTFDIYAWLETGKSLPAGNPYVLSVGGESVNVAGTEHEEPVFRGLTLAGGTRSTVTLLAEFYREEDGAPADAPGLYVLAVPTAPKRLTSFMIGALIRPTPSDAFAVSSDFESMGEITDYAAFTYWVNAAGNASDHDVISVKWKSQALTLIKVNGKDPATDAWTGETLPDDPALLQVSEGDFGDGFDRKIEWKAQSDRSDYFVFFRGANWDDNTFTWQLLREQVKTEQGKK